MCAVASTVGPFLAAWTLSFSFILSETFLRPSLPFASSPEGFDRKGGGGFDEIVSLAARSRVTLDVGGTGAGPTAALETGLLPPAADVAAVKGAILTVESRTFKKTVALMLTLSDYSYYVINIFGTLVLGENVEICSSHLHLVIMLRRSILSTAGSSRVGVRYASGKKSRKSEAGPSSRTDAIHESIVSEAEPAIPPLHRPLGVDLAPISGPKTYYKVIDRFYDAERQKAERSML